MDNLKSPATGFTAHFDGENTEVNYGFTKLELAALMMVPVVATYKSFLEMTNQQVAENAVDLAKAILQECNK